MDMMQSIFQRRQRVTENSLQSGWKTPPQPNSLPAALPVVLDGRVVTGTGGGPDKTILNSPRFLEPRGYRNLCAYLHHPADAGFDILRVRAESWNAPLISILDHGPLDWRVFTQLLAVCRRERVAIWHGHDYKTNALGLLLRRFWPMRLVTTVHGWGVKHTRRTTLYYAIDRRCLPHYEVVIAVSSDLHQSCLEYGVPAERCILVENGIDTEQFARTQDREHAKARFGVPRGRLLIGAIGRLSEEKGFDRLIRAADRLIASGAEVELRIAGDGNQASGLHELIRSLGQEDRIRLIGFQSDTRPFFEAMDIFALSSLREGLPNVVLEAMAMEVAVVATRIAGVPRLVEHEENGMLVDVRDAEQLASTLARLAADGRLRARLGKAGRRTVESRYSFEQRMERIREIYDGLLAIPCGAAGS
jgi:glycosyltransferase involved in cell wall biosynthesis